MSKRVVFCLTAMALLWLCLAGHAQTPGRGPLRNPFQVTADNPPITVRVLVLNYDPFVPDEGGRRLHEVLGYNDPRRLAAGYQQSLEYASDGAVRFKLVEWRDLDEIYAQKDGYRYKPQEYIQLRHSKNPVWHNGGGQDYPRLLREQGVVAMIDAPPDSARRIDEVWIFGDHFFGLWEASMAGPGAFFINGGVYPEVPSKRPFAFYGFSYERGVAEMLHDTCHRVESTLNRAYGQWDLKAPKNDWELFSANVDQSNGLAGVGTCHWPANATKDYDYGNPRVVQSWAEDFLNYPNLTCRDGRSGTKPVSRATWSLVVDGRTDDQWGYLLWYFTLLPRAPGAGADGRQHNWWKYVYDFVSYAPGGKPRKTEAANPALPTDSGHPPPLLGPGELQIAGKIERLSVGRWEVRVGTVTVPGGAPTSLSPTRLKVVKIPAGVTWPAGLKRGSSVVVTGKDAGAGRPLTAHHISAGP